MNKKYIATAVMAAFIGVSGVLNMSVGVSAEVTDNSEKKVPLIAAYFPDENFRNYIAENFDTDSDGYLSYNEALEVTEININIDYLSSLAGIEFFTNLKEFECHNYKNLKSINLTANRQLEKIKINALDLTSIRWSTANLKWIEIYSGKFTSLDLSQTPNLEYVDCRAVNTLISIDASNNPNLKHLACPANNLSSLDFSNCPSLEYLDCSSNNILSLDVSDCTALEYLYCYGTYDQSKTSLTSLEVSNNPKLKYLDCYYNSITDLDISNNPLLEYLDCHSNSITSLDTSSNPLLKELRCSSNVITSLDVSNNLELQILMCDTNQLESIDVSNNVNLLSLYCGYNNLDSIDISNNTNITNLSCTGNNLFDIDVSHNAELSTLDCGNNNLTSIDVSNNPRLHRFICYYNRLTKLDLGYKPNLRKFDCHHNQLTSLDLSGTLVGTWWYQEFENNDTYCVQTYNIGAISNNTYSLDNLPAGFDPSKAFNWQGAEYDPETNSLINITGDTVTYSYDCGTKFGISDISMTLYCTLIIDNKTTLKGDANRDGYINSRDAALILRQAAGYSVDIDLQAADVNGDGSINSRDAALILRYAAGYDVKEFDE